MKNNTDATSFTRTWVKTGKDIIGLQLTEVPSLVKPFIPKVGTMSLAGSSDLGKSYFLLQLGNAIINGETEFLGFPLTTTHKGVIYLSTEDDEYSLCPRLLKLSQGKGDLSAYENLRVVFETRDLVKRLDMLLREMPADMVIIDTFSDVYDGDMNQANKVRSYIQKFKEIANRHKTLIVFNHHCGKKNDFRPPHKDNLLGSQGFESCMRTVIELRKDFGDTTKRHMCIVKGNYIPESFKNSSYKLEFSFDQGFMYTGERVTFEKLIKVTSGEKDGLQERVLLLKKEGLSYSKIAEKLTSEGHKISKSKVGNICKNYRPAIQEPIDDEMDGQEAA